MTSPLPSEAFSSGSPSDRAHIAALDGVRGIAILLVLVFHLSVWGSSPADRLSFAITGFGGFGVDLFFVLSGFLITRILWTSRGPGGLKRFWIRRALRIWPLYLALLAGLFVVLPLLKGWDEYPMPELWADRWYYWLHATNLATAVHRERGLPYNTGHLWSLAIEEQFYLVWPLIVWRIRTLKGLLRCSLATIGVAWALRVVIGGVFGDDLTASLLMPTRMDGFAFGAAIFALSAQGRLGRIRRPALIAIWPAVAVALAQFQTAWGLVAIRLAASICHASVLAIVLTGSARLVDRPWLRLFGKYSYGLYMIHMPLIGVMVRFTDWAKTLPTVDGWSLPATLVNNAGITAVSLALAMASYHLYEQHFLDLKEKWAPRPASIGVRLSASPTSGSGPEPSNPRPANRTTTRQADHSAPSGRSRRMP